MTDPAPNWLSYPAIRSKKVTAAFDGGASMGEVAIIGVDLAKSVFQVHGAAADGSVEFRKKLSRPQFAGRLVSWLSVAIEADAHSKHFPPK